MEPPDQQQTENPSPDVNDWLSGGGEMGKVVRGKDWSNTPLGPIESWPQSLRTTVSLCLASNFPISIAWGPERVQIYNDGYWPICATKHPHSMGQDFKECWASPWPVIGEAFERASNGETCFLVNQRMFLDRLGYLEETFFTFSFSPIRDESGGVGGLFHPVTELTQQSLAERRLGILRDLANQSSKAASIDEAMTLIAESVEKSDLDVPFALIYRLEPDGKSARLVKSVGLEPGLDLTPHCVTVDESQVHCWPFGRVASAQSIVVNNLALQFGQMRCGPYDEPPGSAVVQHILLPGMTQLFGFFVAGVSSRRPLDESYSTFYDMLGDVVTNTLGKARAYEEERKRAVALAELDRAKTAFFSNVSHEFRTPLTLMLGPLEELLAQDARDFSPSARGHLQLINRNGLRLLRLVNTLLDFSRIEAGRVRAAYAPTDLAALTSDLASSFRAATDQAGLSLIVDCHTLSEPVYIDQEMWEKIVLNLMSNAFKFTFGGNITVTLREVAHVAELRVCDTGVGIPPNHLSRIFDRFHRVENTRSRTHEGSGIGLGLVKELVKLHGGSIRAESIQDEGSTFIVAVPLSKEHLPADQIVAPRTEPSTTRTESPFVEEAMQWISADKDGEWPSDRELGNGDAKADLPSDSILNEVMPSPSRPHVLLADDNADMRQYVSRILAKRYEVYAVADGEAALASLSQRPYDLVLSDVMMPRLDGFGLLQKMRKNPATRTIPLILLSARAGEESRVEGLEQGADDYLIKPFSARELLARVDAHVNLARVRLQAQAETQKFVSLVGKSRDFIGMCDLEYKPFFINESGMAMVGLDGIEQARRLVVQDFFLPEDQPFIQQKLFPQVLREGQAEVEIRFRHFKTGEFLWMICHVFMLRDTNGNSIGFATVSRNITGRKQAEEALRQSEERFRSVFQFAATGIAIKDLEDRLQQCNPAYCSLLGYTEDEIRGLNFANLVHPEDRALNMTEIRKLKDQKLPFFEIEHRYLHKDGISVWVRKFVSVLRNDSGIPTHLVAFVTDITERKQVEGQLYKWKDQLETRVKERTQDLVLSQARLRSLASQLSLTEQRERRNFAKDLHDNLAQLLVVGRMKLEQGKKMLSVSPAATRVVLEVDDIFNQALTYSRTTIAELSPPPLHEAGLSTSLMWLTDLMAKHGLVVDVHMSQESIQLSEDRAILVFQSVRELLMNVLKHAGVKQATVKVLTKQDGEMCIAVEDSGKGLDADAIHRAQEPGHLGLFAVQERMEAVGGQVEILSNPGQGTKVTLVFPKEGVHSVSSGIHLSDEAAGHGPSVPNAESVESRSNTQGFVLHRIRVLLVDDHAMLRRGLQTLLDSYDNLEIIGEAGDGEEAVSMAERLMPDVVVMDINMPKLNGIEATRQIVRKAPAIKIIGYSVNDSPKILAAILEAGAVACYEKTGSGKEVYQAICAAYAKQ